MLAHGEVPSLVGTRIAVVGGGIIGLAAARAAARAGAQVSLLEARRAGRGSTAAASGLITLALPRRSAFASLKREGYPAAERLLAALAPRLPPDAVRRAGAIDLALELPDPSDRERIAAEWGAAGHSSRWLSPDEAAALVPGLDPDSFAGALAYDRQLAVDPDALVAALVADFEEAGGHLFEELGPISLLPAGAQGVRSITAAGDEIAAEADLLLLAAGWESAAALGALPGAPLALAPVGGIGIDLAHAAPGPIVHFGPDRELHWVPRRSDRVYLGSTVRRPGDRSPATEEEPARLLSAARVHFPALGDDAVIVVRDGLRPKAERRGGPYLGPWPGRERLWVATGHYRSGVATAALTAEILVRAWAGEDPPPAAFAVARGLGA